MTQTKSNLGAKMACLGWNPTSGGQDGMFSAKKPRGTNFTFRRGVYVCRRHRWSAIVSWLTTPHGPCDSSRDGGGKRKCRGEFVDPDEGNNPSSEWSYNHSPTRRPHPPCFIMNSGPGRTAVLIIAQVVSSMKTGRVQKKILHRRCLWT